MLSSRGEIVCDQKFLVISFPHQCTFSVFNASDEEC